MRCAIARYLAVLAVAVFPISVWGAESSPVTSSRSVATLIADIGAVAAGQPFNAALRIRLAPGWHTYWQNPGDAGIPPSVDWSLPPGSEAGPIEWPLPQRIAEGTLTTYAYTGDVVLPFTVHPSQSPLMIKGHAEWLACKEICVPEAADLELTLPAGPPSPAPEAALIRATLAHVPATAPFAATLASDGTLSLSGESLPKDVVAAQFFPAAAGVVERAVAQHPGSRDGALTLQLDPAAAPPPSQGSSGVIALTDAAGVTTAYTVTPKRVAAPKPTPLLGPLLLLAVAGGLLLNLMPCVFPILAMKAVALARLSGAEMRRVRSEAASYCAGVVGSFVVLGAGMAALRGAGQLSGWGFQFQSPTFVIAIAWLLFAIGLSFSGVFAVGTSMMGRGHALAGKGGHLGSVLTGVLAVVVATPCTAPFMGTAIAGALALQPAAALAVFAALGVGLALPYALIALVPRLSRALPRPGSWMVTLQQLLAFPMYAAAVWLVWVVSQQAGPAGVLTAGAGSVAVGLGAWAWGFANRHPGWSGLLARGSAGGLGVVLAALLYTGVVAPAEQTEPFTTARLEELRSEGRPVFVNMTASWCLSCLVNERLALSPAAVKEAFARSNVAYLKGDWTSQNPAISAFLHQLGQDGVPLYVLYPPGGTPVVLPQLLSEGLILGEIAKLRT